MTSCDNVTALEGQRSSTFREYSIGHATSIFGYLHANTVVGVAGDHLKARQGYCSRVFLSRSGHRDGQPSSLPPAKSDDGSRKVSATACVIGAVTTIIAEVTEALTSPVAGAARPRTAASIIETCLIRLSVCPVSAAS